MSGEKKVLSRRTFLKAAGAAAAGAAVASCVQPTAAPAPAATAVPQVEPTPVPEPAIKGGPLEVGVIRNEGPWYDAVVELGTQFEKDFPGTKMKYTFNNTATDAARNLRWEAGDPLDIDTGRWSNQASATWDWVDKGYVLDLTDYLEETLPSGEKWKDIYAPITHSYAVDSRPGTSTPGRWFGVPQSTVLMLMHYNQRAFDEMGVEPAKTWDEFLTLCATIDEKGAAKGMKPICVSGPTFYYTCHWWDRLTQRFVGREGVEKVLYGDGHVKDDPNFLAAAKELEKLVTNNWLMEGYEGSDFTTAQALFFQGKAAMIHMGTWLLAEMADSVPDDFVMGTFDFPQVPQGKGNQQSMFGTAHIYAVPNPAKSTSHEVNVPLSVEWLKRFCGREFTNKIAQEVGDISPCTKVDSPPRLPGVNKLLESASQGEMIVYYYGVHWDTALTDAWMVPTQALFLKKINAEQMIETIDANLDQYRKIKAEATPAS